MAEASDAGGLKLLGFWGSPFSLEIQVALKLKGIPYDYQEEDLEQGKSEALLHSNPIYMAVPVLVHDGRPLAESLIILEYLDESFGGPPLLPSDPYSRSRARFWADFFYQKVVPALRAIIIKEGEEQEMVMKEARERLREFEQGSLELKREGPFFNGGSPGLLDIVLGSARCWIRVLEDLAGKELMSHETTPALCPIAEALADLPAFQEAAPQHQRLLAYALRLRSRFLQLHS